MVKYVDKVRTKIDYKLTKNLLKKTRVKIFLNEYKLSFLKSSKLDGKLTKNLLKKLV